MTEAATQRCNLAGANASAPAACYGSLRRRGLRFRHHQPGWLCGPEKAVLLAGEVEPCRRSLTGARRSGAVQLVMGKGFPAQLALLGPWEPMGEPGLPVTPNTCTYSPTILSLVSTYAVIQGVWSAPRWLGVAIVSHGLPPAA